MTGSEIVQVEQQQHEGVAEAVGPLAFVSQTVLEHPVAGDAGEGVDRGGVEELSVSADASNLPWERAKESRAAETRRSTIWPTGEGAHLDAGTEDEGDR